MDLIAFRDADFQHKLEARIVWDREAGLCRRCIELISLYFVDLWGNLRQTRPHNAVPLSKLSLISPV